MPAKDASKARIGAERRGRSAETLAQLSYLLRGYVPVAKRLASPVGEIDLVMRRGRTIVFAEVKARATRADAAYAVTAAQQRRIAAAANLWLSRNPSYIGYNMRFDAVLVAPWRMPHHIAGAFTL